MRILAISNLYPPDIVGGWEIACQQMVEALRLLGHDVRVVTSTPRLPIESHSQEVRRVLRAEEFWDDTLRLRDARGANIRAALVESHNVDVLGQEIEAFEPDVVYLCNLIGLGAAAIALAVELRGLPWAVHMGDSLPIHIAGAAGVQRGEFAAQFGKLLSGTWIACSSGLIDEISAGGMVMRGRVEVIPNWITGPRNHERHEWFERGQQLRCVYHGQLIQEKGTRILIDLFREMRDDGVRNITIDIWGDGPDGETMKALVLRYGLSEMFTFHGKARQDRVLGALGQFDVMIFPTYLREPFGLAPLEAAARGCVPIVSAGCGVTEWLVEGVHLLTARRDAASLAQVLREVLSGRIDLHPIGRRAQAIVSTDYHIDAIAPKIETLLVDATRTKKATRLSWNEIVRMARIAEVLADSMLA